MNHAAPYTAEPVLTDDTLSDIRIRIQSKTWHLWGRMGRERETGLAADIPAGSLPVLLGSGLGHCLDYLLEHHRAVAVVDKESAITELTEVRQQHADDPRVMWIDDDTPQAALDHLTRWQADHDGKPFAPIILPLYQRMDRPYYGALADTLKASATTDFWSQARYPKFASVSPRILFFDSRYFLCNEILTALDRLDIEHHSIPLDRNETGSRDFVETLLKAVIDFKPDFVLTVNHFGLDREGKLAGLLQDLGLPLASWFVDNPHLILHQYAHPGTANTAIFTYDAGNLDIMRDKGFANVHYLPLATDPERFTPGLAPGAPSQWTSDVSFVGNSMTSPVADNLEKSALPDSMRSEYETVARAFDRSGESDVARYLSSHEPTWNAALESLPTPENRLALESLITWEATRQYRLHCVEQLLPFVPLIVGDDGWETLLPVDGQWRHLPGLDYYTDLPRFYPCSSVNFNCTSRQMIGAVNQRVFDVPACGGFVLTDYREQMEDLFDLDTEMAFYRTPEEIPVMIERALSDGHYRQAISTQARKRILAEHTYVVRMTRLVDVMRKTFSS